MVLADVSRSVDGVERALMDMDLMVMAPIAFLTAGGMVVAQEAVDLVFPQIGLSDNPSNNKELGAAAIFKMALAIGLAYGGTKLGSTTASAVAVVLAIGVLGHSGADIIDLAQSMWTGFGGSGSSSAPTRSSRASGTRTRQAQSRSTRTARQTAPSSTPTTSASTTATDRREEGVWG
jgi:hypothetical protein